MILDKLKQKAMQSVQKNNLKLVEFEMCGVFTYAKVTDGIKDFIGVTLTPIDEGKLEIIEGTSIKDILGSSKYDVALRAVTLAVINAIGQYEISKKNIELKEDMRKEVAKILLDNSTKEDKIVFIGHLTPVVAKLKEGQRDVEIFCRTMVEPNQKVYNDIFEYEALSKASIVVITGAALIGSTIDAILKFTGNAKMVLLAGFSAGANPAWYKDMGFTHIISTDLKDYTPQIIKKDEIGSVFENPCYVVPL